MTDPGEAFEIDPITLRARPVNTAAMLRRAHELRALSATAEDPLAAAGSASNAAMLFVLAGELEQATPLFDFALARQETGLHPYARTVTEIRLAQLHQFAGRLAQARVMLEDLVQRCTINPDVKPLLDFAHQHLAKVLFDMGDLQGARASFGAALALRRARGAVDLIASTELALAEVARRLASEQTQNHEHRAGGPR